MLVGWDFAQQHYDRSSTQAALRSHRADGGDQYRDSAVGRRLVENRARNKASFCPPGATLLWRGNMAELHDLRRGSQPLGSICFHVDNRLLVWQGYASPRRETDILRGISPHAQASSCREI